MEAVKAMQGRAALKISRGPRQRGTWGPLFLFKLLGKGLIETDFDNSITHCTFSLLDTGRFSLTHKVVVAVI